MEFNDRKMKISLGRGVIMLIMLAVVIVGGTFAWFNFSSKQSALVLTVGDINDTQIKLTPYQIKGEMTPVNTYTSGVYSEVEVTNGNRTTSVVLYYKINDLDVELIDNGLAYTIIDTSNNSTVKTGYFSDLIDTTETLPESVVILDQNTTVGSTSNYKVYLWLDSSKGNQSAVQGSSLDIELNGSIGSVTISGTNTYGQELTANVVDTNTTATYTYQWFASDSNATTGGTAISGVNTTNKYTVGSGLAGKYIYVVAKAIEDYYDGRTYTDVTDGDNNGTAQVDKENSSMSVTPTSLNLTYPNTGTFTYTFTGDGTISCSSTSTSVATCSVDTTNKKVTVTPKSAPGSVTITLSLSEGTNYKAISKDVSVSVVKGTMTAGTVTISGTNTYNETLTATVGTDTSPKADSYSYQWWYATSPTATSGTNISGATSSTYKIGSNLVGKYIGVTVTAKKNYYNNITFSDITNSTISEADNQISGTNATIKVNATKDISTLVSNVKGTLNYSIKSQTTTGSALNTKTLTAGVLSADNDNDGTVVVTVTDDGGTNYGSSSVDVTITVQKYTRTLTWDSTTPSSITYGDTSKKATVSVSGSGGTAGSVSYTSGSTGVLTINSSTGAITPVGAGNSSVKATLSRTTTVKEVSVNKTINIGRKQLDVSKFTYSPLTKSYDGTTNSPSGFKVTPTTTGGLVSGDTVTISYTSAVYNNANVDSATTITVSGMTLGGTHASRYTLSATSYEKTGATITKKSLSLGTHSATYNGTTSYSRTFSTGVGSENVTLTYKPYAKTAATYGYVTSAASGKYTVTMANGTGTASNYSIGSGGNFTINKKGLAITAYSTNWVSGATTYARNSYSTGVNSETINLTYKPYANTVGSYTYATSAASGKFTLTLSDSTNYSISSAGDLTINKINATCPTITDYSGAYDGSAHGIGVSGGTGGTIKYSANSDYSSLSTTKPTITNVGSITTYVQIVGDGNHNSVNCGSKTATVTKKSLTITAKDQTITYGSSIATGTGQITSSGLISGHSVTSITLTPSTSNVTSNGTITPSAVVIKNGTTDVTSNYNITYTAGKLVINAKNASNFTITLSPTSYTYDGTAKTPTVTVKDGDTILTKDTDYTVAYSNNINASTSTIKGTVTVTGKGNYTGTKTATFTIDKANLTITAKDQTVIYGNSIETGTDQITSTGLISGHSVTSITLTPSTSNVTSNGTITPSAVVIKNGTTDVTSNYNITYTAGNLVIIATDFTISFDAQGGDFSTASYTTSGEHTYAAPFDGSYKLEVWGAQGGSVSSTSAYIGGYGGYSVGTVNLNASDSLYVNVGGKGASYCYVSTVGSYKVCEGGYNGGGAGTAGRTDSMTRTVGSGGGATHIATVSGELKTLSESLSDILIVAGGGGGANQNNNSNGVRVSGANGGGYIGNTAVFTGGTNNVYATGGTQSSGGVNGSAYSESSGGTITAGFGFGADRRGTAAGGSGGGGGGGYYGGGVVVVGPGAGGSGYIGNSLLTDKAMYCYECETSSDVDTLTYSITDETHVSDVPTSNYAKIGAGAAKITLLNPEILVTYEDIYGDLPVPTKDGYTFVEWNTKSDGTGKTITSNSIYNDSSVDTLYAIWSEAFSSISEYSCANETIGTNYEFTYTGNCEVINLDDGSSQVKFLTTGDLTMSSNFLIDAFLVGGGGGGGKVSGGTGGGGGGGGYRITEEGVSLIQQPYTITIGAGGATETAGETTSAFGYTAAGGNGGKGATGGTGGAKGGNQSSAGAAGGYEFDGTSGTRYGGGGGGGGKCICSGVDCSCAEEGAAGGSGGGGKGDKAGTVNTGGGGGGGNASYGTTVNGEKKNGAKGGSGIVIIRTTNLNIYTVTYDANGGEGAPRNQSKITGIDLTLSTAIPTRDGYIFLGWSTLPNATNPTYDVGGTYTVNASITLYAVWKLAGDNVILNGQGGIIESFGYSEPTQHTFVAKTDGSYKLEVWGAQGGDGGSILGGYGGYSTGIINLNKNDKLYIYVGGTGEDGNTSNTNYTTAGGYNGGGSGYVGGTAYPVGGGGGASDIRYFGNITPTNDDLVWNSELGLNSRIIVAGGGAGSSRYTSTNNTNTIGHAGGYIGVEGKGYNGSSYYYASGGTQTGPGENKGDEGGFGFGANSSASSRGGGGGGWYGGNNNTYSAGGGSGYIGSSLLSSKSMYCYNCLTSSDVNTLTYSTTNVSNYPTSYYAKEGDGAVKIGIMNKEFEVNSGSRYGELPVPTRNGYVFLGWNTKNDGTGETITSESIYNDTSVKTLYAIWEQSDVSLISEYSCANETVGESHMFTYTGNCSVHDDGDGNWRVKFLTSGDLTLSSNVMVDAFLVGGGGGGGSKTTNDRGGGGGGGGYTKTIFNISLAKNNPYTVTIGSGGSAGSAEGTAGSAGKTTSAFNVSVDGGKGGKSGSDGSGGAGGSGGGGGGYGTTSGGNGGSYGKSGSSGIVSGGSGQGSTTCEFGEGTTSSCYNGTDYAYSGGGAGGEDGGSCGTGGTGGGGGCAVAGTANKGGGGGGGKSAGGAGGSGIVVIRNNLSDVYNVSYNSCGGSELSSIQTKIYAVDLTLSEEIPTRTGYVFLGWATEESGGCDATSPIYEAGGTFTTNANTTLYAVWQQSDLQYNVVNISDNSTTLDDSFYTLSSYNCNNNSTITFDPYSRKIISSGIDRCDLNFTKQSSPKLYDIVEIGDYISYTGNNGCSGNQCYGWNASQTATDTYENYGSCRDNDGNYNYKFITYGWRVLHKTDNSVYIVSAGAPECLAGTVNKSTTTITNINNVALKYCNTSYAAGGICDVTTAHGFNGDDFYKFTSQSYGTANARYLYNYNDGGTYGEPYCGSIYNNEYCGYYNDIIDNGGFYWFASAFSSTHTVMWYPKGNAIASSASTYQYGVRPVIKLDASVLAVSGTGTSSSPYIISTRTAS